MIHTVVYILVSLFTQFSKKNSQFQTKIRAHEQSFIRECCNTSLSNTRSELILGSRKVNPDELIRSTILEILLSRYEIRI